MQYRSYKDGILRTIAAILAALMVFSNEMAVCSVVYVAYGSGGGKPVLTDRVEQDELSVFYNSEINAQNDILNNNTQTNNIQNLNEGSPVKAESSESIAYAFFCNQYASCRHCHFGQWWRSLIDCGTYLFGLCQV